MGLRARDRGKLVGKMAWDMMATEEMAGSFANYCTLLETKCTPKPVRHSIYDATGQFRTYEFHCTLIFNDHGEATGMRVLCVDISESQRKMAEIHRSSTWLRSTLASLAEPILLTDSVGIILYLNPAAEQLLGWKHEKIAGRLLEQALPLDPAAQDAPPPTAFSTHLESSQRFRVIVLDAQGHSLRLEFHSSPVTDLLSGHISGVVSILSTF
jgi:PAS domain S-box-containing protein